MQEPRRVGFVDESYGRDASGRLTYVLGLVLVDRADVGDVQAALRDLTRKRGGVLHFANEDVNRRTVLAKAMGELPVRLCSIVVRSCDSESRARAVGLRRLAWEKGADLDRLVIESRGTRPDSNDAALLSRIHPPTRFQVSFVGKQHDPMLWAADFVASATFQALARGVPDHLDALGPVERNDC